MIGIAFYHRKVRRTEDGWKIAWQVTEMNPSLDFAYELAKPKAELLSGAINNYSRYSH